MYGGDDAFQRIAGHHRRGSCFAPANESVIRLDLHQHVVGAADFLARHNDRLEHRQADRDRLDGLDLHIRDQESGIREKRRGDSPWSPASDRYGALRIKKGFDADIETQAVYPDEEGVIHIEIRELERVEIHLPPGVVNISPLPIGSTFDPGKGIFYWQPGPGFVGVYRFVFVEKDEAGQVNRKDIIVNIAPM